MKTTPVTAADLARSVLSVPPLARRADLTIDPVENAKLMEHLRSGGVSTRPGSAKPGTSPAVSPCVAKAMTR